MSELKPCPCPICGAELKINSPEDWTPTFYDPDSGGDPYNAVCDCGFSFGNGSYDYEEFIAALNRRAQPANEPLTLEQVKQATGEIWIYYPQETWGPQKADAKDLHCSAYAFPFDTYGKTWLAYRRPPERSESE